MAAARQRFVRCSSEVTRAAPGSARKNSLVSDMIIKAALSNKLM